MSAIRSGITKVNVSTHLNGFFTDAVRRSLAEHPEVVDSRRYVREGRAAVTAEAARLLTLFAVPEPATSERSTR
jgi:fructose-bisphosphate aldolase class II